MVHALGKSLFIDGLAPRAFHQLLFRAAIGMLEQSFEQSVLAFRKRYMQLLRAGTIDGESKTLLWRGCALLPFLQQVLTDEATGVMYRLKRVDAHQALILQDIAQFSTQICPGVIVYDFICRFASERAYELFESGLGFRLTFLQCVLQSYPEAAEKRADRFADPLDGELFAAGLQFAPGVVKLCIFLFEAEQVETDLLQEIGVGPCIPANPRLLGL